MGLGIGLFIGLLIIGVIVAVVIVGIRASRNTQEGVDPLMDRLADAAQRGEEVKSLEAIEMQQPFAERVIVPIIKKLGDLSARFTPQNLLVETTRKIELAGNPGKLDAGTFLSLRFVVAALFGGVLLFVSRVAPTPWSLGRTFLLIVVFVFLGFNFPGMWLQSKISRRQNEVRKAMPDALDLLTICVEAGLGFDAAMAKVGDKWENELSLMFTRCIREVQLGKPQREALRDMESRLGLPELTSFVAAVIQSQILGVSLSKVLRIQSDQMRVKRRQRAEELAHQAPVKMIIPMAFLTFPSILIIMLAPAGFQIAQTFGGGGIGGG
ncbi:MAG: type II secretion system F family protein [Anaerolineales bacterium]|nr:type II secretion system F family protein [Anaerolineales bacterium]MCZ2121877.1 type II secretion system F family protein [Anaerolineales bacterium]